MRDTLTDVVRTKSPPNLPAAGHGPPAATRRISRFALTRRRGILIAALAAFFAYANTWPLWHTDLWGHLAYGRLIWQTGRIPKTEPFMPLSAGIPLVDTAWLTQVAGFLVERAGGLPALQFAFAAGTTACLAILAGALQSRNVPLLLTFAGLAVFVAVGWQHLQIVRPQLAGMVCFVLLFSMLVSRRWRRANWVGVAALFAVWANVHGSFIVGLATIGCFCIGRAGNLVVRSRDFTAPVRDKKTLRLSLLLLLAAVAVVVNPYGLQIYRAVASISSNDNLAALVEWGPLTIRMRQGRVFAATALLMMMLYRLSPRRASLTEVLLLFSLGGATLWTSRMIVWFAPIAAFYLALHASAVWKARTPRRRVGQSSSSSGSLAWSAVALITVCVSGAFTPLGQQALGIRHAGAFDHLSRETPVEAAQYLHENASDVQIFNTYEWGDYLVWAGPAKIRVFVASHAHLVPEPVWRDYLHVINVGDGWERSLDRHQVRRIVLSRARHAKLADALRKHAAWQTEYEDDVAVIFKPART